MILQIRANGLGLQAAGGKDYCEVTISFPSDTVPKWEIPIDNPVYLILGASFGSAEKGTGLKALEFALSICESVDTYGFTVDAGYKEWRVGAGSGEPLAACSTIKKTVERKPIALSHLRKAATDHKKFVKATAM